MAPLIPTLPLQDGHSIPAIGFGTGSALRDKDAYYYVVQALEGGFNHIDTAQIYHNEETVGIALQNVLGGKTEGSPYHGNMDIEKHAGKALRREDIWVTTKYYGAQGAEAALDASLEKNSNFEPKVRAILCGFIPNSSSETSSRSTGSMGRAGTGPGAWKGEVQ
ncbi:aldo/keto reductase family protein [Ceratobasidium sp. AG-Ba]|nr:aldo/keto reductase family protein [Ceratobasidium sp. AG-Ba]QRW06790.1 aldo/keto reductase family protein [Ceratobasidium sp. AG-Ba]